MQTIGFGEGCLLHRPVRCFLAGALLVLSGSAALAVAPKAAPAPKGKDRPEPGDRAVVFDDRYRPPAKDLLLTPANERKAEAFAHFMKGVLAEEAGEPEKALPLYVKALAADPTNVTLALKVSSEYLRRGDSTEAVELLKDTIKASPKDPSAHLALAYVFLKSLRKPDLAAKSAEQALALDGNSFLAYAYLADAYSQLEQTAKVNAVLARAAKSESKDPKFWLRVGEMFRTILIGDNIKKATKENLERTNAVFAKAQTLAGNDVEILHQIANYYASAGQVQLAIPIYLRVLSLSPEHPSIREKLAYSYIQSDQRAKAIAELEAILKADPAKVYAYEMLGQIYEQEKQYERAIVNYEQVLLLTPNQPSAYQRVAELFAGQLKRPDKAIEVLGEARRRFSDLPAFSYLLARALTIAKRYEEALSVYEQTSVEAQQSQDGLLNGGFYFDWAAAAERAGKIEKAVELFRRCLRMEDSPEVVAQASNYLGYMWVDRNENLEEAGELIRRALQIDPQNGAFLDSLGWYYFRVGKYDKALVELLRAAENVREPDSAVFDHLGDCYAKLKNEPQALNYWQKALELESDNEKIAVKVKEAKARGVVAATAPVVMPSAPKKEE